MIAKRFVCALVLSACAVWAVRAQEPAPKPTPPPTPAVAPPATPVPMQPGRPLAASSTLMVEVSVNRMRDGKRISSVPYTLAVVADGPRSTLRIGGEVPVPTATFTPNAKEPNLNPLASYSYRNVGTNIDVTAQAVPDNAYRLNVTFEESSVYPPGEAEKSGMTSAASRGAGAPAFRSLRASNAFNIRDGQTVEFSAGSDLISGETARIAVKITIAK